MKKSTLILLISTAIFFTSTLVLLYLNYLKPTTTFTPTTGTIPTDTPIPTIDPTSNLKSYTDNKLQIQFKYPSKYKLDITEDKNFYGIYLKGTNYRTEANDLGGIMSLGTFFVFSNNDLCETTAVPELQTLILKNNNYSLYKIKGIEGPDYKVAVIKKSNGGCINFICNTDDLCEGTELVDFQSILSTFKFTDQKEESALDVAKKYLDAYVSADWVTAKQYNSDPNFDEAIANSYSFIKYTITGQKADTKTNYYHIYASFTDKNGEIHNKPPYSSGPLEVLMVKDNSGQWKALTWYFYP